MAGLRIEEADGAPGAWEDLLTRAPRCALQQGWAYGAALAAIFRRDIPMLQGTILVLALFFVFLNVVVDLIQTAVDPRIKRA